MSTSTSGGSSAPKADELKRLQAQVDQMKERLDFISPMLPLVNFVQDYFQKVECEASVQLMRLKNANVYSRPQSDEDKVSNAQLETVKWLHFMTDVVMQLHNGSNEAQRVPRFGDSADSSPDPTLAAAAAWRGAEASGGGFARPNRQPSGSQPATPPFQSPRQPPADLNLPRQQLPPAAGGPDGRGGPQPTRDGRGPDLNAAGGHSESGGFLLGDPGAAFPRAADGGAGQGQPAGPPWQSLLPDLARVAAASAGALGRGPSDVEIIQNKRFPGMNDDEFMSDPATAGMRDAGPGGMEQSASLSGLVLGRGSWATAYRQASGQRRDALRLLCMSGIVTARELSDDLTVISQEHIDECVFIASEMLQTMPLEMWSRQPQEAKKVFEARLTALYQRKFGEIAAADARQGGGMR